MNIDEMTIGDFKKIATLIGGQPNDNSALIGGQPNDNSALIGGQPNDNSAWKIGANYLIRTVTMIDTGRLIRVTNQELILEDAAWIADTGRFSDALKSCAFGEVEPFPSGELILGRGSIIDAICISKLPKKQK